MDEHISKQFRRTDDEVHEIKIQSTPDGVDKLHEIFNLQSEFMKLLGVPKYTIETHLPTSHKVPVNEFVKMLTNYSQTCTTAISCETTELLDALPWKPWKKNYKEIDLNNIHLEIIDIFHFVIELSIIWGMTPRMFFDLYIKKMIENIDRQKKGY